MFKPVIAGFSRSPFTMARKGALVDTKPVNLLAEVIKNLVAKSNVKKEDIEDIVVDSEVRGKMIGVSLIKELIKVAKNKGCYRITLFCKETLVNFYGRNGFEVNNVVMKKYL